MDSMKVRTEQYNLSWVLYTKSVRKLKMIFAEQTLVLLDWQLVITRAKSNLLRNEGPYINCYYQAAWITLGDNCLCILQGNITRKWMAYFLL